MKLELTLEEKESEREVEELLTRVLCDATSESWKNIIARRGLGLPRTF